LPGTDVAILGQLAALGLIADEPPVWQSKRSGIYEAALAQLSAGGWAYPCGCTRTDVARALARRGLVRQRHGDLVYPGTCRDGLHGRSARAMRMLVAESTAAPTAGLHIDWHDRRLGTQHQDVTRAVGDLVLRRADGLWAYQLAVVVDDSAQGVTHVVRGEDLADNTPRQIHLQHALGLPTPIYLHTPLVLGDDGSKLSKQNGARPIDTRDPLATLRQAALALGLHVEGPDTAALLANATACWRERWLD
jgi:glutamyl-Q tRNA(Asp) synthetase